MSAESARPNNVKESPRDFFERYFLRDHFEKFPGVVDDLVTLKKEELDPAWEELEQDPSFLPKLEKMMQAAREGRDDGTLEQVLKVVDEMVVRVRDRIRDKVAEI